MMFEALAIPAHLAARPASFASLMDLYECNYIAMRRLCPVLPHVTQEHCVSRVERSSPLHFNMLERGPYTSTLKLSQYISETGRTPSLPIRVYHDARQAEVLLSGIYHEGLANDMHSRRSRRRLDICWQANLFLNDWLEYCLAQGHRF